ncbi:MAG: helix-turn-helix domain-containing protein [Acidimicrobiales bacterium]
MATRFQDLIPVLSRLASSSASVDLDQVGRDACLSPTRAQRVFAATIGESPKQYQSRVRLQRAAALLLGTEARIIDIAMASGFQSHEAFTRAFRQRFDKSPSQYRAAFASWPGTESVQLAAAAAPCIGVYRRPLTAPGTTTGKDSTSRKGSTTRKSTSPNSQSQTQEQQTAMQTPGYEINRRDTESIPVLFGTRKLDRDKIADGLAEVLPAAFGYAMAQGLAMAGPPFVRYIDQSPAFVTVEAGVPLAEPAPEPPSDAGISAGSIPAASVATTIHKGPYETLGEAYVALDRWMDDQGVAAAGPSWEVYLTDPAEVPDPAEWLTEINWPISG